MTDAFTFGPQRKGRSIVHVRKQSLIPFLSPTLLLATPSSSSRDDKEETQQSPSLPQKSFSSSSSLASCWNPQLRQIMTFVAGMGAMETAYLTVTKGESVLCAVNGSCSDVLTGPYSAITIPNTTNSIPLSALGCIAYTLTAITAITPVLRLQQSQSDQNDDATMIRNNNNNNRDDDDDDDTNNRIALLVLTTALGTFSTFLMSLLFQVLHQSCLFCFTSACFSWTLAACAWGGDALPPSPSGIKTKTATKEEEMDTMLLTTTATTTNPRTTALQLSAYSFMATAMASVLFFVSVGDASPALATTDGGAGLLPPQAPPAITATSSPEAIDIVKQLKQAHAKMYGAYWCSHCYDQKQLLGKEALTNIYPSFYIECSKDGVNSQAALCKERNVPGYPTWEINGKLYPGEQELDELQQALQQRQ